MNERVGIVLEVDSPPVVSIKTVGRSEAAAGSNAVRNHMELESQKSAAGLPELSRFNAPIPARGEICTVVQVVPELLEADAKYTPFPRAVFKNPTTGRSPVNSTKINETVSEILVIRVEDAIDPQAPPIPSALGLEIYRRPPPPSVNAMIGRPEGVVAHEQEVR